MRLNESESFFHPVTHQLIERNSFYKGAAHLDHENIDEATEVDEVDGESKGKSKAGKSKANADNTGDGNEDDNK
jgi:hypothetical protein